MTSNKCCSVAVGLALAWNTLPSYAQDATIAGSGTGTANSGAIPRFKGPNRIQDSVISQDPSGNISINGSAATAVLQVNKRQPPPSTEDGTNATTLFKTTGGKGGNTTSSGTTAGKGGAIFLKAGNGGEAVPGSTNGNGGDIRLQPGLAGTGGTGGQQGGIFLAPLGGNVGIGTTNPQRALQIGPSLDATFTIEPSDGSPRAGFIRFGDNTGWQLRIGRSREFSGGPLNTGLTGSIVSITDIGVFHLNGFPLGATGVGPLCRTLSNAITMCESSSSSLRYKTDIEPFRAGMDLINRLNPIAFTRNDSGRRSIGLAAEEVDAVESRLAFRNENDEPEGVKYELLSVALVNAVKEQDAQLQQQQRLIEQLQARLAKLEQAGK